MASPVQDIKIWEIQDRTSRSNATRPWVVRWKVDGAERSRAYRTRAEADRLRSRLVLAAHRGEPFDRPTGLPLSWQPQPAQRQLHEWVRDWLAEQWAEWQPRTRASAVEAMSRFLPAVRSAGAPAAPGDLRRYLVDTLAPGRELDEHGRGERWLAKWSPTLEELTREMLARAERELVTGVRGQPLGAAVSSRYRKTARAAIVRAVDLGIIGSDPWPPPPRGRRLRKAIRTRRSVDVRRLPNPATMTAIIAAIRTHQPGSRIYEAMTAVAYYGGLRPSEVFMTRAQALVLPMQGWGAIDVVEADIGFDEPGEPKTGPRVVPIPPVLVARLRDWVAERSLAGVDLLFRTRNDKRPSGSNWSRALTRAAAAAGQGSLRPYDCRHAAATTWLSAGVPLRVVALRLGHSVETLVFTYVGALEGDDDIANVRIDGALAVVDVRKAGESTRAQVGSLAG